MMEQNAISVSVRMMPNWGSGQYAGGPGCSVEQPALAR